MKGKKNRPQVRFDYEWYQMIDDYGLKVTDINLLSIISNLQNTKYGCVASYDYFENIMHITNIHRSIKRLELAGIIKVEKYKGIGQSTNRQKITIDYNIISRYQNDICLDEAGIKSDRSTYQNEPKHLSKVDEAAIKSEKKSVPKDCDLPDLGVPNYKDNYKDNYKENIKIYNSLFVPKYDIKLDEESFEYLISSIKDYVEKKYPYIENDITPESIFKFIKQLKSITDVKNDLDDLVDKLFSYIHSGCALFK